MKGEAKVHNIIEAVSIAICLVLMLITEWRMALSVAGAAIIGLLLITIARRRAQRCASAQREARSHLRSYAEEIYRGHDVVRLSRAARQTKENFRELNGVVYSTSRRTLFPEGLQLVLVSAAGNLAYVALWISGTGLVLAGQIGLGVIAAFMLYTGVLILLLNRRTKRNRNTEK